jgi:acyl-CoA synthetase (AMP-forming)/AMP-acid ligase II
MTKMVRYLNFEEPNNSVGPEWFNTLDQVVAEGEYLRVLGRSGDLINVGGRKFFPSEIENLIRDLQDVKDVNITAEKTLKNLFMFKFYFNKSKGKNNS